MQKNKSFTLIELLVVIAIIGLLSSIVLVSMQGVRGKARIAKGLEFSQSVQNALGANAVGWWSFETIEGGKVIDGSGYGNDGTVTGAVVVPGLEQLGNALSFNGVSDYVNVADSASLDITNAITIEAWVKFNVLPSGATVSYPTPVTKSGAYSIMGHRSLAGVYSKITDSLSSDHYAYFSESYITTNTWYHLVTTYNGTTQKIYLNGVIPNANGTLNWTGTIKIGTTAVRIGGTGSTSWFNGLIDEVRIYSQALSAMEIQKHYVEGLAKHQDLALK